MEDNMDEFWAPLDPDEDADPPLLDWERDIRRAIAARDRHPDR